MTDHSMSELLGRLHKEENPWVSCLDCHVYLYLSKVFISKEIGERMKASYPLLRGGQESRVLF